MKIIKQLSELIESELDDAEYLIKKAVEYRDDYPNLSNDFYNWSIDKNTQIKTLHDTIVRIIKNYKDTEGDPPAPMMAIYNYIHERHIEKMTAIKSLQTIYKEEKGN